jgi:hypothetical protein
VLGGAQQASLLLGLEALDLASQLLFHVLQFNVLFDHTVEVIFKVGRQSPSCPDESVLLNLSNLAFELGGNPTLV